MLQIDLTDLSTAMDPDQESVSDNTWTSISVSENDMKKEFFENEYDDALPKREENKDVPKVENISVGDVPKYKDSCEDAKDQTRLERPKKRPSRWDVPPTPPTPSDNHEKVMIKTEFQEYFEFHEDYETLDVPSLEMKKEPTFLCKSENSLVSCKTWDGPD